MAHPSESLNIKIKRWLDPDVEYPVIVIPEGVTVLVAAKRALKDSAGNYLIREADVYFRTLGSNGTPSNNP